MAELHQRLKQAMEEKKMTQTELCQRTGIPKSAVSQYISGAFKPKQERTRLIAKALGVSESWLMGYDGPSAENTEISDDEIKFALWGGSEGITDEMYEEVKQFAEMVKLREENRRKK
ncbi:MAG: helix-turn-helix domain-containing protein [Porcipelethomonas sp.]